MYFYLRNSQRRGVRDEQVLRRNRGRQLEQCGGQSGLRSQKFQLGLQQRRLRWQRSGKQKHEKRFQISTCKMVISFS